MELWLKVVLVILAIMFMIVLVNWGFYYYGIYVEESECGIYQRYVQQTLFWDVGTCESNVINGTKCTRFDGDICVEWYNVNRLVKRE